MVRRPFRHSHSRVLDEATNAFVGLDEFVERLAVSVDDDGAEAIHEMQAELGRRTARAANNPVLSSTAIGLEKAYRLSILQRIIDARFGIRKTGHPDNAARRPKREE